VLGGILTLVVGFTICSLVYFIPPDLFLPESDDFDAPAPPPSAPPSLPGGALGMGGVDLAPAPPLSRSRVSLEWL
jgi:hypothetical protein